MNKIIYIVTFALIGTLFFSCDDKKAENLSFDDWDKDDNNMISEEEFTETFTNNYYDDWDGDDDPYLDDEDFFKSVFSIWDDNRDKKLEADEWVFGHDNFYGNYVLDDFTTVDSDEDGFVQYVEYEKVLAPSAMFVDWDKNNDNDIDEVELASGLFAVWDNDDSQFLEKDEYAEFDTYYLDL